MIIYFLVRLMPDTYLYNLIGQQDPNPEVKLQQLKEYYGIADNTFFGICKGYFGWLFKMLQGDLGISIVDNQPVADVIFENMGISFAISLVSLVLQLLIAIPLGIKCACNQYGKLDYTITVLTMIGISFPSFFFGSIVIKTFAVDLGWFPDGGLSSNLSIDATAWERFWDMAWHLVLPMMVLVILNIGSMMRYTRTNTLEVLNADYIRTARAKGLSEKKVVYKHVFRNTLIPLVTTLAGILPGLFGGAMITEEIFGIPGIGQKAYQLLLKGDLPFIMGYNMFIAVLTVIGILLTDIMYAVVDPRVKLGD
jgi:peptide/nickel transport system permease protein